MVPLPRVIDESFEFHYNEKTHEEGPLHTTFPDLCHVFLHIPFPSSIYLLSLSEFTF